MSDEKNEFKKLFQIVGEDEHTTVSFDRIWRKTNYYSVKKRVVTTIVPVLMILTLAFPFFASSFFSHVETNEGDHHAEQGQYVYLSGTVIGIPSNRIIIRGQSNLPQGAKVTGSLYSNESKIKHSEQTVKTTKDGQFLIQLRKPHKDGEYLVEVVFLPEKQSKEIQNVVGVHGEYLLNHDSLFTYEKNGHLMNGLKFSEQNTVGLDQSPLSPRLYRKDAWE